MKNVLKAQSSIEFLIVIGMALMIALPFIASMESAIVDTQSASEQLTMQNYMDELQDTVKTVSVEGEPAKRTKNIRLTSNIEEVDLIDEDTLLFTLDQGETQMRMYREMGADINIENFPQDTGLHKVEIEAWNGQVNLSEKQ